MAGIPLGCEGAGEGGGMPETGAVFPIGVIGVEFRRKRSVSWFSCVVFRVSPTRSSRFPAEFESSQPPSVGFMVVFDGKIAPIPSGFP